MASEFMSQTIPITHYGVRRFVGRLAQTLESQGRRVSQKVMMQTADGHRFEMRLREYLHTNRKLFTLDLNFTQICYDEHSESVKRDDDFCDAFAVFLGGQIGEDRLSLPLMTENLRCPIKDDDLVPRICAILSKAVSAELCACGKQIVAQNDEMCFTCMLGLEASNPSEPSMNLSCPICSRFMSKQSPLTSCCKRMSHGPCLRKCSPRCPFCRNESFTLTTV